MCHSSYIEFATPSAGFGSTQTFSAGLRVFTDGDATITLRLPVDADDLTARNFEKELVPIPSVVTAPTYDEPGFGSRTAAVQLFVVEAVFMAALDGERPDQMSDGHPYWQQATLVCETGQALCDTAANEFLSWLRAKASSKQPWLGLISEPPRQYGRAGLRYAGGGEVMGYGPKWEQRFSSPRLRLEQVDLDAIGSRMVGHQIVPVASELLSDALYLAEGSRVPDLRRAVITAAIACEVRVDEVVKERVSPERAKLAAMMMKRSSNLTFSHEVFDAAFDLSLKVADVELWKRVDRLRRQRNAVVHAGAEVDAAEVNGMPGRVGVDLFRWLDENVAVS